MAASEVVDGMQRLQVEDDSGPATSSPETLRNINIVFIGHVDAGKSTLCGHLLYLTGNLDERTLEKYEKEAKSKGRESWKFAWALDLTEQERSKGKTTDYGVASFRTRTKHITIIDAPGHKAYVPAMISGTGQADVAILVISARKGEFEAGFERGGQTREHAMLAKTAGVRQLVVVVNKMDEPTVQWSQERFRDICDKLTPFLKQIGYRPQELSWVPVSGYSGENLRERVSPSVCSWYRGGSLLEVLDALKLPPRPLDVPVRMTVVDKFREMGVCILGKVESGIVRNGDRLLLMPPRLAVQVAGITVDAEEVPAAEPGDNVKLLVKGVEEDDIHPGQVLCAEDAPVEATTVFDGQIMLVEHKSILTAGYRCVAHIQAAAVEVVFERLLAEVDRRTNQIAKKYPKFVRPGSTFIARLAVAQPVCVTPFKDFAPLGRFMLRDEGTTIGAGVVLRIPGQRIVSGVKGATDSSSSEAAMT
ncbi:eukaryotic peptide chain release factor gtp-binding subunit [Cyanidiococcus yangmingshanensis]|uniref:Eukaryotic peptide chain release factor gtp-binding subunit n=1 Tax=Cyanidiococcus yangmingshanensis TaxID=2690220 RepID=A0A7J7IE69_9RHOD|nr:eukaryotic peptide chain release factor gtp-binding subunit [Cyanidiococcus yangmingshanensis]